VEILKLALLAYFSSLGNTQKVGSAIKEGLESGGMQVDIKNPQEANETDFF
jgi:flavodoxin